MKKILSILIASFLIVGLLAGCGGSSTSSAPAGGDSAAKQEAAATSTGDTEGVQASPEFYAKADLASLSGKKIGVTIQSLQNSYWAGVMTALEEVVKKHPSDAAAVEDACAEARTAGIKVMCWDDPMTNTDANWVLNNTDLGIAIGEAAGNFISEHYTEDNKAQIAMINYPQTTILLEREEGILQGLESTAAGLYEVVSSQAGLDANQAQTAMETILQRYPDCRIVTGIGAGAMIGTDEALQIATGGKIPEDMGVFTADVTKQQLEHLMDDTYPARVALGFEGSDEDTGTACASMFALILADNVGAQNVFRGLTPITAENVEAIMAGMK